MRVLLVEDSPRLRKSVTTALKSSGYAVDSEKDGEEGLWQAQNHEYDVVILDIMLPGLDGLQILEKLRKEGNEAPILLLTAKDTIEDRVHGLRSGADDYLVKPFALEELLARVETLSRHKYQKRTSKIQVGDLELDSAAKTVQRAGQSIDLAAREFSLLEYLMLRKGQVVSRTQIEEHIYDDMASPMSNVVDSAICALRKHILVDKESAPLIHTRRGQGYVMESRQ